jgi:hypothetical protein
MAVSSTRSSRVSSSLCQSCSECSVSNATPWTWA